MIIEQKLSQCVVSTAKYSVAYLDIDNFKAYNDVYGFENGYITTANRHGEKEQFPLITLTCVVVNNQTQIYKNVFQLTEMLAVLKKRAKSKKDENRNMVKTGELVIHELKLISKQK